MIRSQPMCAGSSKNCSRPDWSRYTPMRTIADRSESGERGTGAGGAGDDEVSDLSFPILGRPLRARRIPAALRAWLEEHWHRPEHAPAAHPFTIVLEGPGAGGEGGERGHAAGTEDRDPTNPAGNAESHH